MNILIVGGGGREHALAWKAAQSPNADRVFVAPGNAGTALEPKLENVPVGAEDLPALVDFARKQAIGLTIIGPEAPLVAGVVDAFTEAGLRCFGPSRAAAQLEGSKVFSKDFLARQGIPTAAYGSLTEAQEALDYVKRVGLPIVIKADGLAAGKGVIIAEDMATAQTTIEDMLSGNRFGEAGHRVLIEEFLQGEEASFIVMADGRNILPMASSQDHKPRDNGDKGPNTGGMGAYSPAPVITPELHERVMAEVIRPTVAGMAAEGHPYTGFLYAGLMIDAEGNPRVLEYNCRFGDPETQPIMLRLRSDLVALCDSALDGALDRCQAEWDPRWSLGVVMAAGGYPDAYAKGDVIQGLPKAESDSGKVFHAGTLEKDGEVLTDGGRVLCATALGDRVSEAQRRAYDLVNRIHWKNVYFRTDIGYRAVAREQS